MHETEQMSQQDDEVRANRVRAAVMKIEFVKKRLDAAAGSGQPLSPQWARELSRSLLYVMQDLSQ